MKTATSKSAHQPHDIPQEAFDWYDEYAHGQIDRRTFLNRLASIGAVGVTTATVGASLMPNYALAEQVSFNDPEIKASYQRFDSPQGHGEGRGYLVVPSKLTGPAPVVLVIHENRGLNPYIKDVARRLAKQGFIALAPDALHPVGGYPGNDDEGRKLQRSLERAKIEQDFIAAAKYLHQHPNSNGKLGAVGFCFGGYVTNMLAGAVADILGAGVVYYGTPASKTLQSKIKGPLMIHLAELDKRVNATWPDYRDNLDKLGVKYTMHEYEAANHGFHNDSTARFNEAMAELSWQRTLTFFTQHLAN